MDKTRLINYLERIDDELTKPAILVVYGAASLILLDLVGRSSIDIDVAGPYSTVDQREFNAAAEKAGLLVNPNEETSQEHIEWVSALRLCLPKPDAHSELLLWEGQWLTVKTVSPAQLIASKLIRYDPIDQGDIRYLWSQGQVTIEAVKSAVASLPVAFKSDAIVLENLDNLKEDTRIWETLSDE